MARLGVGRLALCMAMQGHAIVPTAVCLELQPASAHQPLEGGSGLAIYAGLAFNTGVGELDDLPANVGVGVRRGPDGAVDLLGIREHELEHGHGHGMGSVCYGRLVTRDPVGAYRVPPSRLNSEVWRG